MLFKKKKKRALLLLFEQRTLSPGRSPEACVFSD